MSAEIAQLWKQPCFDNLNEGVRLHHGDRLPWLHMHYAYGLFYTSNALPMKASAETLKLETARRVVAFERGHAERALTANGFITRWTDEQCEAIAREMAEAMPRHPGVVEAVERTLTQRRDEAFADKSLTQDDELFTVYQIRASKVPMDFGAAMMQHGIEVIKEDAIVTIDRSMDYLSELRSTKDYRRFIPLLRVLTILRRVHDVVIGR